MAVPGQSTPGSSIETGEIADLSVTTAKIADDAVTYAKMQDVSATDRLLGRVSALAGVIEEVVFDTDVTLAANSDDRAATQKAIKTYVDTAVGGVGGKSMLSSYIAQALTITTGGTNCGVAVWMNASPKAGTYKIIFIGIVSTVSGTPSTVTLSTPASYALQKTTTGLSTTTLVAANTSIASYAKGSTFVAGDSIYMASSSNFTLAAGDTIHTDTPATYGSHNYWGYLTVNNATNIVAYGNGIMLEQ